MDVGSGVTTRTTSGLIMTNSITESVIPAPVSIITTSYIWSSFTNSEIKSLILALSSVASSDTPEPPEINPIPSGPCVMISVIDLLLCIRSNKLYCGRIPSMTSTFANPKSASNTTTFLPRRASSSAILTDNVVLPTPPLPEVIT